MINNRAIVADFWQIINEKRWEDLPKFFAFDAKVLWPNTAETFEVPCFVAVNKNYPGDWKIEVKKIISSFNTVISVVGVSDGQANFHAVSFFYFVDGMISCLEEYWGDDGEPPLWRQEML